MVFVVSQTFVNLDARDIRKAARDNGIHRFTVVQEPYDVVDANPGALHNRCSITHTLVARDVTVAGRGSVSVHDCKLSQDTSPSELFPSLLMQDGQENRVLLRLSLVIARPAPKPCLCSQFMNLFLKRASLLLSVLFLLPLHTPGKILIEGEIRDAQSNQPIPARIYIRHSAGQWHFPKSPGGSAVRYERINWINTNVVEMHSTLSAHPFQVELPSGQYTFRVERGKEYFPETKSVTVSNGLPKLEFKLKRWINLNERGWYSGDTHNHRNPAELGNVLLSEDVNVGLPMVDWTTVSTVAPTASDRGFSENFGDRPVHIDATHVWHPRNTEYEIFRTGNSTHTLGALLILNHRTRFDQPVFPLRALADKARQEGALLDLEKHNWDWSLALVPLLKIDLFELANNHHWQTDYAITNWGVPAPAWMKLAGSGTDNERDWTHYGFQTYYALLNSGFRLRPAAGTANGVHPVPLGFSRVYVQLDQPFTFDDWMRGLNAGRSFVTTGPMIFSKASGKWPGENFPPQEPANHPLECIVLSEQPLESIELIVNGEVVKRFEPPNQKSSTSAYENKISTQFRPPGTSWIAWRCFEKRDHNRFRFAHTAPWYFEIPGKPLRPRREQTDWLVSRVREEIKRSEKVAPESLLSDYRESLRIYEAIAKTAL